MKTAEFRRLQRKIERHYEEAVRPAKAKRDADLAALQRVFDMARRADAGISNEGFGLVERAAGRIAKGFLKSAIEEIVKRLPDAFTFAVVQNELRERLNLRVENVSSITQTLRKLAAAGVISVSVPGAGRSPTVYRGPASPYTKPTQTCQLSDSDTKRKE